MNCRAPHGQIPWGARQECALLEALRLYCSCRQIQGQGVHRKVSKLGGMPRLLLQADSLCAHAPANASLERLGQRINANDYLIAKAISGVSRLATRDAQRP